MGNARFIPSAVFLGFLIINPKPQTLNLIKAPLLRKAFLGLRGEPRIVGAGVLPRLGEEGLGRIHLRVPSGFVVL